MIEIADLRVAQPRALDQAGVELQDAGIGVERAAALILPGAGDRGDGQRGVHVDRAVALARKAVAEAEKGLLRRADQMCEGLDLGDREAGDGAGPFRRPRLQMRFQPMRIVGVFFQIGPVGEAVAKQDVHDRAGERAVGAGTHDQAHISLLHRRVLVDVDDDDPGAALLARPDRVGHDVDLGDHGIGAPDHHAVGSRHLARVGAAQRAGTHHPAGPREIGANRAEEARIFPGVAQPFDAVALHQTHRSGIEIGPHGLGTVACLGGLELLGHQVERGLPACLLPDAFPLGAGPHQRLQEPVGMVDAFGVAGDLGADDAGRVAIVPGAMNAADTAVVEDLDVERAGRRTVVRTGRMANAEP